ncbi:hypothetical protein Tco_0300641 [Tanacetum coccineum]
MGWVVCSDAIVESCDVVLVFVVTVSCCICDAVSSHYRAFLINLVSFVSCRFSPTEPKFTYDRYAVSNGSGYAELICWDKYAILDRELDTSYQMEVDTPYSTVDQNRSGVSVDTDIQCIGYGVLEFLGVGTTFDIFQNINILYFQYGVLVFSGYGVLNLFPLWSLVSAGTDTPYLP